MTDTKMRELDAWIEENVFGLPVDWEAGRRKHGPGFLWFIKGENGQPNRCEVVKNYCTDPAASFDLLKKLSEDHDIVVRRGNGRPDGEEFYVHRLTAYGSMDFTTGANTLELAIALFAKKLHSK